MNSYTNPGMLNANVHAALKQLKDEIRIIDAAIRLGGWMN